MCLVQHADMSFVHGATLQHVHQARHCCRDCGAGAEYLSNIGTATCSQATRQLLPNLDLVASCDGRGCQGLQSNSSGLMHSRQAGCRL